MGFNSGFKGLIFKFDHMWFEHLRDAAVTLLHAGSVLHAIRETLEAV
jgi:hypothetical protein